MHNIEFLEKSVAKAKKAYHTARLELYEAKIKRKAELMGLKLGSTVIEYKGKNYLIAGEEEQFSRLDFNTGCFLWIKAIKADGKISEKGQYLLDAEVSIVGSYVNG
jgi:hypothetical protein|nr:MAG TPA: hypothetical protein [Caudoviricetes sp.]